MFTKQILSRACKSCGHQVVTLHWGSRPSHLSPHFWQARQNFTHSLMSGNTECCQHGHVIAASSDHQWNLKCASKISENKLCKMGRSCYWYWWHVVCHVWCVCAAFLEHIWPRVDIIRSHPHPWKVGDLGAFFLFWFMGVFQITFHVILRRLTHTGSSKIRNAPDIFW